MTAVADLDFDPNGLLSPVDQFAGGVLLAAMNGGISHWARVTSCDFDGPAAQIHEAGVDRENSDAPFRVDLARIQHTLDTLMDTPHWLDLRRFHAADACNLPMVLRLIRSQLAAGVPLSDVFAAEDIDAAAADLLVQLAVYAAVVYGRAQVEVG